MAAPEIAVIERVVQQAAEASEAFHMDEDAFRVFYDRTARGVWAYLARVTGSRSIADDLLQEAYYRFLRSRATFDDEGHRRRYLFRIATNLARDAHRRRSAERQALDHEGATERRGGATASPTEQTTDVRRAMARLKPRERAMLWLAYAEGSTHEEIAATLGIRARSVRVMLFRARGRLRRLLGLDRADDRRARR